MTRLDVATGDVFLARFKQMGAYDLSNVRSQLHYIIFKIEPDITVSYVYNINIKNQYFLQRISPYPLSEGLFSTQEEIVDFIERDIEKFKNATQSTNFNDFLEILRSVHQLEQNLEHLFLNYNVSKELIQEFSDEISALNETLQKAKSKSTYVLIKD